MSNWRDEALGEVPEQRGGDGEIKELTQAFLANKPGFAESEVRSFLDNALVNDAREIAMSRRESREMMSTMESFAEMNRDGGDQEIAAHYEKQSEKMREVSEASFESRREALGTVVHELTSSGQLVLSAEAREALGMIDHDGRISELTGMELSEQAVVKESREPARPAPRTQADFSRDLPGAQQREAVTLVQQRRAAVKSRQQQASREHEGTLEREAEDRVDRQDREPVLAGEVVRKWFGSQGRNTDGSKLTTDTTKDDGPEMG